MKIRLIKTNILQAAILCVFMFSCSKNNNGALKNQVLPPAIEETINIEIQEPNKFMAVVGQEISQKILVSNKSSISVKDLSIQKPNFPLSVYRDSCSGRILAVGQTCHFEIKFSPRNIENSSQNLTLDFYNDNHKLNSKVPILYSSRGKAKLSISNIPQLSALAPSGSSISNIEVKNEGAVKIKISPVAALQPPLYLQNDHCNIGKIMEPNESCKMRIIFSPRELGNGSQNLIINYVDEFEQMSVAKNISYLSLGKVELMNDPFEKLSAQIGSEIERSILIKNIGIQFAENIKLSSLESPLSIKSNTCSSINLEAGKTCEVKVAFKPVSEIDHMQFLSLEYKENSQIFTKKIEIPYVGFPKVYPPNYNYADGLRITSYNTMLLSTKLFPNYRQNHRAELISGAEFLKSQDVIVFQEMFENSASDLIQKNLKADFPYQTPIVGRTKSGWDATLGSWNSFIPENGGVAILSKWPILEKSQYLFKDSCGSDAFSLKGFAYVKINFNGNNYHIIGTHLQSEDSLCGVIGSDTGGVNKRKSQLNEIAKFIQDKRIPQNEYVLISGDMNIDRNNSSEFENMLQTLNVNDPRHVGVPYSFDTKRNGLAIERYEEYKSENLDFIFVTKEHKQMPQWFNLVIDVPSEQWTVFANNRTWAYTDYSDHYPVMAFAYADHTTPVKSYVPETGTYHKINFKSVISEKYISQTAELNSPLVLSSNSSSYFNLSNNFSIRDNGCILSGDYVRIESFSNSNYFWKKKNNHFSLKLGTQEAESELIIETIPSKNKCLKNGNIVALTVDGKYLTSGEGMDENLILSNHILDEKKKFRISIEDTPKYIEWSSGLIFRNEE